MTLNAKLIVTEKPKGPLTIQCDEMWSFVRSKKNKPGVYKINLLIDITVVVTSQVEMKPHNSAWLLFSHDKERVEYALNLPENAYIPDYIPKLLQEELQRK